MKPLLFALVLLASLLQVQTTDAASGKRRRHRAATSATARTEQQVYICNGPYAKKWHRTESCASGPCRSTVSCLPLSQARVCMEGPCGKCM